MSSYKRPEISWIQLSAVSLVLTTQAYAGGNVNGIAFRDYNANGVQDLLEPGIGGVQVSATDDQGNTEVATSASDGSYTTGALAGGKARVEFTLPGDGSLSFLKPAASGGSSVQFVDLSTGDASGVSAGFNNPAQYCDSNPKLATPCYVHGPSEGNTLDALVGFAYNASGVNGVDGQTVDHYATADTIGTTFGLAYQRSSKTLFAAAFMKRHSGLGPGGTGAIYSVDPSGATAPTVFVDLNAEFGAGTTGVDPHAYGNTATCPGQFEAGETNGNCWFHDPETWTQVGRSSLGDMDISDDESELYVTNLKDQSLYVIPTSNPAGQVQRHEFPLAASDQPECLFLDADGNGKNDNVVPFATKFHDGQLYVGALCTEQGATGPLQDLNFTAYVYTFDPVTHAWQQVFSSGIQRQLVTSGTRFHDNTWLPWLSAPDNSWRDGKKPLLTDLEFDGNDLILGVRDMYADTVGNLRGRPDPTVSGTLSVLSAGDMLRACYDASSNRWTMENNGSCGDVTTVGAFDTAANKASLGGGIGGGEYYFGDFKPDAVNHYELATGAIAQIPGFPHAAVTIVDPGALFSQGVGWFDNSDGSRSRSFEVVPNSGDAVGLGKANGLGDLEALCEQAPIEAGNYIWNDLDGDGIQGAAEAGIDGVTVVLSCGADSAQAVTANGGQYAFSNAASVPVGTTQAAFMGYGENCTLFVDLTQAVLSGLSPTQANADGQADNNALTDLRDSDASINAAGTLAEIAFVTGMAGENNHTLDFGFGGASPVTPAPGCSMNQPLITPTCDNNNTPTDPSDDLFSYSIQTSGNNTSLTYSISGDDTQTGLQFDATQGPFGPFAIADGSLTVALTDTEDSSCALSNVTIATGASCSDVTVPTGFDFGDAPDSYGTQLGSDGARHGVTDALRLGSVLDLEAEGQAGNAADGDGNDEDGVTLPVVTNGHPVTLTVNATNTTGQGANLVCWIDYNGDGVFGTDLNESGSAFVPDGSDNAVIEVVMPRASWSASQDTRGSTYARCRLTTDAISRANPTGAASDGEVEDYPLSIQAPAPVVAGPAPNPDVNAIPTLSEWVMLGLSGLMALMGGLAMRSRRRMD